MKFKIFYFKFLKMDKILVITPSMPTDISLASVAKFMGCQVKTLSTEELRKPDLVFNITQLLRIYSIAEIKNEDSNKINYGMCNAERDLVDDYERYKKLKYEELEYRLNNLPPLFPTEERRNYSSYSDSITSEELDKLPSINNIRNEKHSSSNTLNKLNITNTLVSIFGLEEMINMRLKNINDIEDLD